MYIKIGQTTSYTPDGLVIQGNNAYQTYGVTMGDDFIDTMKAPIALKPFVESKSRLQHGKRVVVANSSIKKDNRDFTLTFVICGSSRVDLENKRRAFLNVLYSGLVTVVLASEYVLDSDNNKNYTQYKLVYLGQNASYAQSITGTECKMVAKFEEPNPDDRPTLDDTMQIITPVED